MSTQSPSSPSSSPSSSAPPPPPPSSAPPRPAPAPAPAGIRREDLRVPLADGTQLYARLWRPATGGPVPALLEYSTGRLTDWTAEADARRHPWFAGHGYACLRVDARGHGNSGGLPAPPGPDLPAGLLDDGAEVLAWLARQPWCAGRTGLLGHGPAATTALRLAARHPDAVGAVVAACPEGGHLLGGALLADALHTAAAGALADAARPPDPRYVGDAWRRMWLARLDALHPITGPATAPVPAAAVPTLVVGGRHDPSASAVLGLLADAPAPVHAVLGPWPYGLPDELLGEALHWWDRWLKDTGPAPAGAPVLRSRLGGRWTGDDRWPSTAVRGIRYGLDGPLRTAGTASADRWARVRSPQHTGLNAGAHRPAGSAADLAPDQREEDGRSVCFDSAPLPEPLEILGAPVLRLLLDGTPGLVAARLCDVAPDGTSILVSRGLLAPAAADATVELAATGHAFPAGHRLRLALSSAYWPWAWPAPDDRGYGVDPSHSALVLPVRHPAAGTAPAPSAAPDLPAPPAVHLTEPLTARPERLTTHDIARHEWRTQLSPATDGTRTHPDGLVRDEHTVTAYRVLTRDPLSAETRTDHTLRMERPDIGWDVTVHTRTELGCDATGIVAHQQVTALEAGDVVFSRAWDHRIPRSQPHSFE